MNIASPFAWLRGKSDGPAPATPAPDAATQAAPNAASKPAEDDAQAQVSVDESVAPSPVASGAAVENQDDALPSELTDAPNTGNPELDAWKKAEQAKLVAALHRKMQSLADKAKTDRSGGETTEQTELLRRIAEAQAPQSNGQKRPAIDLPRDAYKQHFGKVGKFDPSVSEGLADSITDVVLDIVNRFAAPLLTQYDERLAGLDSLRTDAQDKAWGGVRATFGTEADQFKDQAVALSKAKGISLKAALVEVSDGGLIAKAKAAQVAPVNAMRTGSLRSVTATPGPTDAPIMSPQQVNDAFRKLIREKQAQTA